MKTKEFFSISLKKKEGFVLEDFGWNTDTYEETKGQNGKKLNRLFHGIPHAWLLCEPQNKKLLVEYIYIYIFHRFVLEDYLTPIGCKEEKARNNKMVTERNGLIIR